MFEDTALSRGLRTVTVAEGRPLVLRCSHYVSVPRATVTWYSVDAKSRDHWSIVDQTPVSSEERIAVDDRGVLMDSGTLRSGFYARDAMLAPVLAVVVRPCVCHTPVLYRNGCTDRADFLHTGFPRYMLRCVLGKLGYLQK